MSAIDQLVDFLPDRIKRKQLKHWFSNQPEPSISFENITITDKPPTNDQVQKSTFYFVENNNNPKWVLFLCPCGCNEVITLSLHKQHNPRWVVKISQSLRPTLFPSIWRDKGCMSHFWLMDGRIYWCSDSGSSPFSFYK